MKERINQNKPTLTSPLKTGETNHEATIVPITKVNSISGSLIEEDYTFYFTFILRLL